MATAAPRHNLPIILPKPSPSPYPSAPASLSVTPSPEAKFYVLDEECMRRLGQTLANLVGATEMASKIIRALETNGRSSVFNNTETKGETKKETTFKTKVEIGPGRETGSETGRETGAGIERQNAVDGIVSHAYLITDNNTDIQRNKAILDECEIKYTVLTARDMNLFNYQQQVKEALIQARDNNYENVMILNGSYMLHNKFGTILARQHSRYSKPYKVWYLGGLSNKNKDVRNKFNREDYLALYDDIRQAKLETDVKLLKHWRTYGFKEGRAAQIDIYQSPAKFQPTDLNHGVIISSTAYQQLIDVLNRMTLRNVKDIIGDFANKLTDKSLIIYSQPDLSVPQFKLDATGKNKKVTDMMVRNGWHVRSYTNTPSTASS